MLNLLMLVVKLEKTSLITVGTTALALDAADLKAELVAGFPTKVRITVEKVIWRNCNNS